MKSFTRLCSTGILLLLLFALNSPTGIAASTIDNGILSYNFLTKSENNTQDPAPLVPVSEIVEAPHNPPSNWSKMVLRGLTCVVLTSIALTLLHLLNRSRSNPLEFQLASPSGKFSFILLNCLLILFLTLLSSQILTSIKDKVKSDIHHSLQAVLNTTLETINLWADDHMDHLNDIAGDPRIITHASQLLNVKHNHDLLENFHLTELRKIFKKLQSQSNHLGFFIISPDGVNLASSRIANIGKANLIHIQRPDLFKRALQGETVFVPPIVSDVSILNSKKVAGKMFPPTMFFMAPIRNESGEIICLLTERYNPQNDFSRISLLGRIGDSGETLTFDHTGTLISKSRFVNQLRSVHFLTNQEQEILSISLRDPGVNLLMGHIPSGSQTQLPLTTMAASATKGETSFNHHGYRDYRGVTVIGSWTWDTSLNIGICTKIDLAEAMSSYYEARFAVIFILAIILLISLAFTFITIFMGTRTSRALQDAQNQLEERVEERTSELKKLTRALEQCPVSVVITNKKGIIEYINPTFSKVTGYTAAESIGQNPRVLQSGSHPKDFYQELWATILAGKTWFGEFINQRKNGEKFWERSAIAPLFDDSGIITHFVGVKEDITERKNLEQEIHRTKERLENEESKQRAILDNMVDAVITVNREGIIQSFSQAAETIFGYTSQEVIGQNIRIFMPRDVAEKHDDYLRNYSSNGHAKIIGTGREVRACRRDGSEFEADLSVAELIIEDEKLFTGVIRDITERKRMELELIQAKEQAEAANRAKSTFLANMSHEIRTPLNAILGYAQIMRHDSTLSEKNQDNLTIIGQSGNHLLTLISEILEMSKIESGKIKVQKTSFNIKEMLREVIRMFSITAEEKGINLQLEMEKKSAQTVSQDQSKIKQILINLLSNSIKFTESGHIILRYKSTFPHQGSQHTPQTRKRPLHLQFEVEDSGKGIKPNEQEIIFEPFDQGATGLKIDGGTGLGLAISRKYARLMDGDLFLVKSISGVGSVFRATISSEEPVTTGLSTTKQQKRVKRLQPEQPEYQILVINGRYINRDILSQMLTRVGFQVSTAKNGDEGIKQFTALPPHAVIIDISLTAMDRAEACKLIRNHPKGHSTIIITTSDQNFEEVKNQVIEMEADAFIKQPIREEELFEKLRLHLGAEFFYESKVVASTEPQPAVTIDKEKIELLPAALREDFYKATLLGNINGLKDLISQTVQLDYSLGMALQNRLNNFELNTFMHLFKPEDLYEKASEKSIHLDSR